VEENIAMFLYRFSRLKKEINYSPSTLSWVSKEREDLQDLCFELEESYKSIAKFLTIKNDKHTFIIVPFEQDFNEYKLNYESFVSKAGEPAKVRYYKAFEELLHKEEENWLKSGKTKEEYYEYIQSLIDGIKSTEITFDPFNPLEDDPQSLIEEALDWGSLIKDTVMEGDEPEQYEKAWGAWRFFKNIINLNFSNINKRWLAAPELFIRTHVAQSDETPIVQLYREAVRAYTFGCNIASIAMCRALMEYILVYHYNVQAKDLEKIIVLAEERFPNLKKLRMQEKRKISNKVLHNYESGTDIEERAVIDYLRAIKMLVRDVPKKNT